MDVQLPDGSLLSGVPDGTTQEQILGRLQLAKHPAAEALAHQMAATQTANDSSGMDKFNAGVGLAFQNVGRATKQLVGGDYDRENAATDNALLHTKAGFAGNLAGNMTAFAPLSVVPGANTIAGAGAVGATMGAFQPTDTVKDRLKNMLWGGLTGGGTQAVATHGVEYLAKGAVQKELEAGAQASRNSVRDNTLKQGQGAGYVIPPSAVKPSFITNRLEGVAGKSALGQEASIRNQGVTNDLARSAINLDSRQPLSPKVLTDAREAAAEPYRQIAAISPEAAQALEAWKQANFESKMQWNFHQKSGNPEAYKAATASDGAANAALDEIDRIAQSSGNAGLVDALKQARIDIAKIHSVDKAVNVGTGDVDASVFGKQLDNGKPLTGPLRTIGQFQQAFPPYMRESPKVPAAGVSKAEGLASALLATTGAAASGSPWGMLAGALPFASGPTRSLLLSSPYQKTLAANYGPNFMTKEMALLQDPNARDALSQALRIGLPATIPAVQDMAR